jgi:sialidase-1
MLSRLLLLGFWLSTLSLRGEIVLHEKVEALPGDDGVTSTTLQVIATNPTPKGARESAYWISYPYLFEIAPGRLWVSTMQGRLAAALNGADFVAPLTQPRSPSVRQKARATNDVIETFIAPATAENPRNSEADLVVLRDGSLLVGWSEFYGGARDDAPARIAAARSQDGGKSWGARFTLQENSGEANVMSVSFVRSRSGDILLFYLQKNSRTDLKVWLRRSADDARTWSEPVLVTPEQGYHVMNNARVIQLQSGRLLAPVASTEQVWTGNDNFRTVVYHSDDDGRTWKRGRTILSAPKRGAMEPGLIEMKDGRVMQIIRTQTGFIWQAFSSDGGDTWTDATPWAIESPEAPSTLVRVPRTGDWLLVWNPKVAWGNPERTILGANHGGARTPLAAMISRDEGQSWTAPRNVEADPEFTYAYTSVTFHDGRALLTYYHLPKAGKMLSLKFKSVPIEWFHSQL